jgi:hypothetical protein
VASLDSAWLKVKRGRKHVEAVHEAVERWLGTDAYTVGREIDPETGDTVRRAQIKEAPPDCIGLLIGDAVHNFRSALTPEIEERLMFPIAGNQNRKGQPADGEAIFKSALGSGWLHGVPADAVTFIQKEQPYHWSGKDFRFHWLWSLHELDRIDKHRRLALTSAFLDFQFVSIPDGVEPRVKFHRAEGPVKDGDPLVTYSGADKGVHADFTRAVAINEGVLAGYTVERAIRPIEQRVQWMLSVLAKFL